MNECALMAYLSSRRQQSVVLIIFAFPNDSLFYPGKSLCRGGCFTNMEFSTSYMPGQKKNLKVYAL